MRILDRLGLNLDALNLKNSQIVGNIVVYNLLKLFVRHDSPVHRRPVVTQFFH